jgi:hypothetical protein
MRWRVVVGSRGRRCLRDRVSEASDVAVFARDGVVDADEFHKHRGDEDDEVYNVTGFVPYEPVLGCFRMGAFARGALAYEEVPHSCQY